MMSDEIWWAVARSEEISAEKPFNVDIGDQPIVLWRDTDGIVRALEDRCPHRRAPLSLGCILGSGAIQCGYHGWTFDGEKLLRMHLCLRDRGHTKKALFDFMKDVDEEGDGYVTLHKLHRWWFREKSLSPPKPPTIGERRRPVWEEARADMLEENAMRQRNVMGMKARAGRR